MIGGIRVNWKAFTPEEVVSLRINPYAKSVTRPRPTPRSLKQCAYLVAYNEALALYNGERCDYSVY